MIRNLTIRLAVRVVLAFMSPTMAHAEATLADMAHPEWWTTDRMIVGAFLVLILITIVRSIFTDD